MEQSIVYLISTAVSVGAFVLGFAGHARIVKKETYSAGAEKGLLQADITYIKVRTDDMIKEQKEINSNLNAHSERITRVEESVKSAHHRIDEIQGKK